jgi:hypothetical protein
MLKKRHATHPGSAMEKSLSQTPHMERIELIYTGLQRHRPTCSGFCQFPGSNKLPGKVKCDTCIVKGRLFERFAAVLFPGKICKVAAGHPTNPHEKIIFLNHRSGTGNAGLRSNQNSAQPG